MSGHKEENYWPGFVDALSNVVLTLVFVLVVFVFALVLSSDKLRKRASYLASAIQQQTEAKQEIEGQKQILIDENNNIRAQLQKASEKVQALEKDNQLLKARLSASENQTKVLEHRTETGNLLNTETEIKVVAGDPSVAKGEAELSKGNGAVVLVFPRGVFNLDDKAKAALDAVLNSQKVALKGALSSVLSIMGAETYSEGRRLAYFRGLSVRNYLMDKGFGDGRTIHVMIEQGREVKDGRVEIRFHRP
ncbi:MAG: hypothetical protein JXQ84_08470 [Rhodospirillaceae bacterium]|nr:hypothetical protein [Rhodospirillaceae bacterium]